MLARTKIMFPMLAKSAKYFGAKVEPKYSCIILCYTPWKKFACCLGLAPGHKQQSNLTLKRKTNSNLGMTRIEYNIRKKYKLKICNWDTGARPIYEI